MKLFVKIKITVLTVMLTACAPTSYVYLKPDGLNINKIDEVIIMVEYLSTKEGFDTYWDFDENLNLLKQDELFSISTQMLNDKGFNVSNSSLKTSGLITDRSFYLDHYLNKKKQDRLISPPYIIRSVGLEDNDIQGLEWLLAELNAPMSNVMEDYRSHIKNNFKTQTGNLSFSDNTALLIIHVYQPRKSLLSNIEFGVNASNWDTHVGFGTYQPKSKSVAYLIHTGSGDVLWSNKTSIINHKNQQKFFAELPRTNY